MTRSLALTLNALGLYAITLVLLVAFAAQLVLHELPCPLCLLQRIQFAMLAVGPILNLRFGVRPSHYAVSLLTAVAGAGFRRATDSAPHHARRPRLWLGADRLSLLHLGLHRLCHGRRCSRSHAAVRRPVR